MALSLPFALTVGFIPKLKFEIVISDTRVQKIVKAIVKVARTGKIGDGKVFVLGIEECQTSKVSVLLESATDT
jgi:nitrogen regulatory protein PII